MASVKRFEELDIWQRARKLTGLVYQMSNQGEFARDFGLRDQMRRAAVSILSNVAEGFESRTQAMFIEYLGRAKGSAGELRAQFYVALDCGYLNQNEFDALVNESEICSKQLSSFIHYLHSQPKALRVSEEGAEYHV